MLWEPCPTTTAFSYVLSSNSRKALIIGSGFSHSLIAALILISLYSCSTALSHAPFLSWEQTTLELSLPPLSLFNLLVPLSMSRSSPSGQCWVHVWYVKTGRANWFVALRLLAPEREGVSRLMRPLQVRLCRNCKCKIIFLHRGFPHTQELVVGSIVEVLDQSRLVQLKVLCIFNLLAPSDMNIVAFLWIPM